MDAEKFNFVQAKHFYLDAPKQPAGTCFVLHDDFTRVTERLEDEWKSNQALMKLLADEKHKSEALAAELAVEKMQHSVTIADEHESRSEFQDRIRALESSLAAELALRQTAEAYAARNALRVIELEAALQLIGNELSLQADKGPAGEAFRALLKPTLPETKSAPGFCPECLMTGGHKLRCSKAETKRKCPECVYDVSNPFICERCGTPMGPTVAETTPKPITTFTGWIQGSCDNCGKSAREHVGISMGCPQAETFGVKP